MKRDIALGRVDGRTSTTLYVTLWKQPWHRWLIAVAYHLYESRTRRFVQWVGRWLPEPREVDDYDGPPSARRDLRCNGLRFRGRRAIATIEVDEETYELLRAGWR